jgi:excisionase family DNA binding protein
MAAAMTAPKANRRALRAAAKNLKELTTKQAAELTGYTPDHIALLVRRGDLSGERKGRDWFIEAAALLKYVEQKPTPGPKPS